MTYIVAVVGFKGGVSKTTTAVHLAAHLSKRGVTIGVDGDDRNRSMTTWASAGRLPFRVMSLMEALSEKAEYVVVDVRGGLPDVELLDLTRACDAMILPTTPEVMNLDGLRRTAEVINGVSQRRAKIRVLLSMVRFNSRKTDEARALLQEMGLVVMEAQVRMTEAFRDASGEGVLVRDVASPQGKLGWSDYERVTRELMEA